MCTSKTIRIFLASLLLVSGVLSQLIISPVQAADPSKSSTLSPAIITKLDVFIVKVQALRLNYSSDADWNAFLDKLGTKINALKPQYTGNVLILAVLDRLSVGVSGVKVQENITVSSVS